ncbi:MAG: DUF2946 domain-containing protein [Rhodospirillales bacterium]|nr:MAG: DUF2946 domain-containing protein [Rhodospirillales bacterium]
MAWGILGKGLALHTLRAKAQGVVRLLLLALSFQFVLPALGEAKVHPLDPAKALTLDICTTGGDSKGLDGRLAETAPQSGNHHASNACICCLPLSSGQVLSAPPLAAWGAPLRPESRAIFLRTRTNVPSVTLSSLQARAPPPLEASNNHLFLGAF